MAKKIQNKYIIIQDTREQLPWYFEEDKYIKGGIKSKLDTGDYSIQGLEDKFTIERKMSVGEIATNFFEKRFDNELDRLKKIKWPFIVCEFTYEDVMRFPQGSGIPVSVWPKLKVSANFILAKITHIQTNLKIPFILAGKNAKQVCCSIMNQVARNEGII